MKRIILAGVLILFPGQSTWAKTEITGFVDILCQGRQKGKTTFGMGTFEIDFTSEFSQRISFEGAVVIEGEAISLGQTLVDFKLLEKENLSLQIGLIDMPFGLDYEVFAAPDRKLTTPPLVTELMMDGGWSDIGINFHGSLSIVKYNLYVVNGMGADENNAPANQLEENNDAKTVGKRLVISPVKGLEFGFSYAQGPYLPDNSEETISRTGGHIRFKHGPFKIKGEFVSGSEEIPGKAKNEHYGYYLQGLCNISEGIYGALRYGGWKPKQAEWINRITVGLGYDIIENVSLRIGYQINNETPEKGNNLISSQVVICF